ncbi:hypothetical protein GCM10008090_21950 [Arenicella chitinivorans]|uniref:Putative regulatory protein FmdB zinc ribbon domain-containing protein n=1 Tax=Arenicella chitinivorans TaxID=1329800 RepID=A0A918RT48_9GAMM|nr:FmdB family zinc ribbon protein [Arenicella chitinivorans]GHA11780.1 hypothetical protein GCM10008090_21950 [Arenicella chitinivorans]
MPIYQYRCAECGHSLEALQKMSDPKLTDCPACDAPALTKQVTAAAFKLKGTGWYETDFKNSGKPKVAGQSAKTEPTSKQGSESSSSQAVGGESA